MKLLRMRTKRIIKVQQPQRADERGAALVTALLLTLLMLIAGGALILTTNMSLTNTGDSKAEMQAYYAAESGLQATLNVLRGNVAPNPLFTSNPSGSIADLNKISFSRAVATSTSNLSGDTSTTARLSRWLSYDSTYTDRVTLSSNYSPLNGTAFSTTVRDPDNSSQVKFYTQGAFTGGTLSSTAVNNYNIGGGKATITFTGQSSSMTPMTINSSGTTTLGSFTISGLNGNNLAIPSGETFQLAIVQTAPWAMTLSINCTLSGTISNSGGNLVITFTTLGNSLQGALYSRTQTSYNLPSGTTSIPVTVTAPEPIRLIASVNGYGPRSAKKQMQMLMSRFAFDFTAPSGITLRSADDGTVLSFNPGNSAQYLYSGFDNAGGGNLSAFGVTSNNDYSYLTSPSPTGLGLIGSSGQVAGSPAGVQLISTSSLPTWLQQTDGAMGARAFISQMRLEAQNANCYYTSSPSSFGTSSQPLFTFVDGDADLPPAGGAGLLIVTGTLTTRGSAAFDGLVLVMGTGDLDRSGGGNGGSLGAVVIARFGATGNFLAPTFNSNGSGNSSVQYDSEWVRKALSALGPRVMGVSEY
jgi:Tfp pilus assembly protein PilX